MSFYLNLSPLDFLLTQEPTFELVSVLDDEVIQKQKKIPSDKIHLKISETPNLVCFGDINLTDTFSSCDRICT